MYNADVMNESSTANEFSNILDGASKLIGHKSDLTSFMQFFKTDDIDSETKLQKLVQLKHPLVKFVQ